MGEFDGVWGRSPQPPDAIEGLGGEAFSRQKLGVCGGKRAG